MRSPIVAAALLCLFASVTKAGAQGQEDFARFSRAIGKEVSIIDHKGDVREGVVVASTDESVVLHFGSGSQTFARSAIVSAELLNDSRRDGAVKGAVFGLAMAARFTAISGEVYIPLIASSVGTYSGIGFLFDALHTGRQPLYRAHVSTAPSALRLSVRF